MDDSRAAWPYAGRGAELDHVRHNLRPGTPGIVIIGPAGSGRSRLAAEAVRGLPHVRVGRHPSDRHLLNGRTVLVADDAHLLDEATAAWLCDVARRGLARVLVTAPAGQAVPENVGRLWREELLTRMDLSPLAEDQTGAVLGAALGGHVEAVTVRRFARESQGDARLLRALVQVTRASGALSKVSGVWTWRGAAPLTGRVGELVEARLGRLDAAEREALEVLAHSEPLDPCAGTVHLGVLERLEGRGLVVIDASLRVRLAHPLYGPVLRAGTGRLRAARLRAEAAPPQDPGPRVRDETARLLTQIRDGRLATITPGLAEHLAGEPGNAADRDLADFCAVRAWAARLRGEVREAVAWSNEGLRRAPGHHASLRELAVAAAHLGDLATADHALVTCDYPAAAAWALAARGDFHAAREAAELGAGWALALHDLVRLGAAGQVVGRLERLAEREDSPLTAVLAAHAAAVVAGDGAALDKVARRLADLGLRLHAAEAAAQAVAAYAAGPADAASLRAARAAARLAGTLAAGCQGARTPALVDLALASRTPVRLSARQRQIVCLAAAELTNRQIAERLGLSIRTVGNHLVSAYQRLGTNDRNALAQLLGPT
ncbi:helix-turn-helix transcriptional regulator [Streptosporangiaceae bacterium NEAU-GS5]|nr:helix-turn-helix transcriptional regulator [Streptosporangiaceae bacterium NEAU-GS5]